MKSFPTEPHDRAPLMILLSSHALFPSRRSSSRRSRRRRGARVYCVFLKLWNGEGAWALRESWFVTIVGFMPYFSTRFSVHVYKFSVHLRFPQ
jgi:hypothetical protein